MVDELRRTRAVVDRVSELLAQASTILGVAIAQAEAADHTNEPAALKGDRPEHAPELIEKAAPPVLSPNRVGEGATIRDRVLDRYAFSDLGAVAIARELGVNENSCSAFISMGRKAGDQRAVDGDARRGKGAKPPSLTTTLPKTRTVAVYDGQQRRELLPPAQDRVEPTDSLLLVHLPSRTVHGPKASLQTSYPIARILQRMADTMLYDFGRLLELTDLKHEDSLHTEVSAWADRLYDAGIDIVKVPKLGYRAREVEP